MDSVYKKAAEALAQGELPEYPEEELEECVRAFDFLKKSLEGNVFFQHLHKGFFPEWLAWMNAGLAKLSNGTVSLSLADQHIQGAIVFLLVQEGEARQLVLH